MKELFHQLNSVPVKEIYPGYTSRLIHTAGLTLSYVTCKKGVVLPVHHHPEEQALNLLEGEMEVTVGDMTQLCKGGDVVIIPSGTPHTVTPITDCLALDVFQPPREAYLPFGIRVDE
ncbi:MAG: cupin domain-containing protein [Saprospiraceae bacterium]|nr:cupin domain-containing protein [Saprospiraceae bacterium]